MFTRGTMVMTMKKIASGSGTLAEIWEASDVPRLTFNDECIPPNVLSDVPKVSLYMMCHSSLISFKLPTYGTYC
jgi:hypothetical protein